MWCSGSSVGACCRSRTSRDALREIRRALLEADVSLDVTRDFVERVRERAVGTIQLKAVSPGQQVVKLVHDELAALLGGTRARAGVRLGRADGDSARGAAGVGEDDDRGEARAPAEARAEGAVPRGGRPAAAGGGRAARAARRAGRVSRCWGRGSGTGDGCRRGRARRAARGGEGALPHASSSIPRAGCRSTPS